MGVNDYIVKKGFGKNTTLDKQYRKLINDITSNNNEEVGERWDTYNLIVKELMEIDGGEYYEEIRYRLTDNEDPNSVILDIVSRYSQNELTFLLSFLIGRVEEYAEEDFFSNFYK